MEPDGVGSAHAGAGAGAGAGASTTTTSSGSAGSSLLSFRRPGEFVEVPKALVAFDHRLNATFVPPRTALTVVYDDEPIRAPTEFLTVHLRADRRVATTDVGSPLVRLVDTEALDADATAAALALAPGERAALCGVHSFDGVLFLEGVFSDEMRGSAPLVPRNDSYVPFVERSRRVRALLSSARASGLFTGGGSGLADAARVELPSLRVARMPAVPAPLTPIAASPPPETAAFGPLPASALEAYSAATVAAAVAADDGGRVGTGSGSRISAGEPSLAAAVDPLVYATRARVARTLVFPSASAVPDSASPTEPDDDPFSSADPQSFGPPAALAASGRWPLGPLVGPQGFLVMPSSRQGGLSSIRRSTSTPAYMSAASGVPRSPFREHSRRATPLGSPLGSPRGASPHSRPA